MKLLLTGDIHIGRSSSRVPDGVRVDDIRAATVWSRIIDLALREQLDVVCLSGDIVDQDNKFFEAIGPLDQGIRRLAEAGIMTAAVAGNHDFDVFTRLADELPVEHFRLLGRNGRWERFTIKNNGHPVLHLDGWSFPERHISTSPINSYNLPADHSVPILGMVHGDIFDPASQYAPLDVAKLQSAPVNGWLLGHIHACQLIEDQKQGWILYPGSPQALNPGENGPHGPWLVEVQGPSLGTPKHRPLSSVWYDVYRIDLSEAVQENDLESILLNKIRERGSQISEVAGPYLTHISFRLQLAGATPVSYAVNKYAQRLLQDLSLSIANASVAVESYSIETVPAIDLEEYARMHSAPGALARLLLDLKKEEAPDELAGLIQQTMHDLERAYQHRDFTQLEKPTITEEVSRKHLESQARSLLTQLLVQSS